MQYSHRLRIARPATVIESKDDFGKKKRTVETPKFLTFHHKKKIQDEVIVVVEKPKESEIATR